MRCHTVNFSFGSVLFANFIFAWHDSAVANLPTYGQCIESAAEFIKRHVN